MVHFVTQEILSRLDKIEVSNTKATTAPTEATGEGSQRLPNATPRVPRVVDFFVHTADLNNPPLVDGASLHGKSVEVNTHKRPSVVFAQSPYPSATVIPNEADMNMVNQRSSEFLWEFVLRYLSC